MTEEAKSKLITIGFIIIALVVIFIVAYFFLPHNSRPKDGEKRVMEGQEQIYLRTHKYPQGEWFNFVEPHAGDIAELSPMGEQARVVYKDDTVAILPMSEVRKRLMEKPHKD